MTTKFAVVGSPISHSLSPLLHLAAYKHLGLDFKYEKIEVGLHDLASFVSRTDFSGFSVTMPLKEEAFELASWRDELAQQTQAANTLVRTPSGFNAYNTDVIGIQGALAEVTAADSIVVLGSGATAKSALVAISGKYPGASVTIAARDLQKAEILTAFANSLGLSARFADPGIKLLIESELVISTVPQQAYEELWQQLEAASNPPLGTLFDVSYNPWPSVAASAWGSNSTISGIEMLIWQAIRQVEIFTEPLIPKVSIDHKQLYKEMSKAVSGK